eukprot:SAG22_NODE_613_length_8567_cov_4.215163_11_plen_259_part_00
MKKKQCRVSAAMAGVVSLAGLVLYLSIKIFLMPGGNQMGDTRCQDGEYSPLGTVAESDTACRPCGHCVNGNPAVEACGGQKAGICAAVDQLIDTDDASVWSPQNVLYPMSAPPPPEVYYGEDGALLSRSTHKDIIQGTENTITIGLEEVSTSLFNNPARWAGSVMCEQRLADARTACCRGTEAALAVGCGGSLHDDQDVGWWAEQPLGVSHCTRACQLAFGNFTADCASLALFLPAASTIGQPGSSLEVTTNVGIPIL